MGVNSFWRRGQPRCVGAAPPWVSKSIAQVHRRVYESGVTGNAKGLMAGVVAFGLWGVLPIYWKFLESVPVR